jgi:hypothetical protein
VTARLGRELVLYGGPGLGIDQSGMQSGIELALVGNLTGVNRACQQPVEVPTREGFATALSAVRSNAALGPEHELIGRLLDPPHIAKLAIERKNTAYCFGFGGVDDQHTPARVIAERHIATHPHPLLL